jgi:hemoglobin/transferrin/lactoferrin receptor protein
MVWAQSRCVALMCSVSLGILASQGAFAQQNVNATNFTLLERLVIGFGQPKVAIDTPQAVTVVSQEDIDRTQATTTGAMLRDVPGVAIVGSQRQLGQSINIRGIGSPETSSDAARVIVNVDGAPKFNEQYRMGSFFSEPELYKQVEVLRGPGSSTLYGAGALGGVVNFTTKDASDFIADGQQGAIRVKQSVETNGWGTTSSAILAHRFHEAAEVLATGVWRRSDDMTQANGNTLLGSKMDTWSGLVKGTLRFGDNDEQVLRASYQRWYSQAFDQQYTQLGTGSPMSMGPGRPAQSYGDLFGIIDRKVNDGTFVLAYENPVSANPWLDLNVNLTVSDLTNNQYNHRDNTGAATPQTGTNVLADTIYGYRTIQLSADNTIEWIGEDFENYLTTGFQLGRLDRTAKRPSTAQALPAHPEGVENKLGLFVQNEYTYDDRLTIMAGIRGDFHNVSSPSSAVSIDGSAFSPKLAAHYKLNDNLAVFGSVAHTERLPTIDELYSVAAPSPANPPRSDGSSGKTASLNLRKEQANTIEAGFAINGFSLVEDGDAGSVKTTFFYNDLTDLIVSNTAGISGTAAPTYYGNVGKARIYGAEVEGSYNADSWFVNLAYTLTIGDDLDKNQPLTTIPQSKITGTIGGRYDEWNLDYGARVTLASQGEYFVKEASGAQGEAKAFATLDLFANWKPETGAFAGTQIQAGIDNVFNSDFRENLAYDRSSGRTFKISLSKQFDY